MGKIFWLASYPKSGNTWLRALLANWLANQDEPVPLRRLPDYCEDEARPELYSLVAGEPSTGLDVGRICALRARVHELLAAKHPGVLFVKTHNLAGYFDGYPLHNPNVTAGAIYIVRNPLDVAISMAHHFGISFDEAAERLSNENLATGNDALFVTQILGSWSKHVASWSRPTDSRVLVLRYEDLLEKPAKHFARVVRFIGIESSRDRIERAVRNASFSTLASIERREGFAEAPRPGQRFFRVGRANQWREVLDRRQIAKIVADHRQQMARFHYLPGSYA